MKWIFILLSSLAIISCKPLDGSNANSSCESTANLSGAINLNFQATAEALGCGSAGTTYFFVSSGLMTNGVTVSIVTETSITPSSIGDITLSEVLISAYDVSENIGYWRVDGASCTATILSNEMSESETISESDFYDIRFRVNCSSNAVADSGSATGEVSMNTFELSSFYSVDQ